MTEFICAGGPWGTGPLQPVCRDILHVLLPLTCVCSAGAFIGMEIDNARGDALVLFSPADPGLRAVGGTCGEG